MRKAIAKTGGFKISDIPVMGKFAYWGHLNGLLKCTDDEFMSKSLDEQI